MSKKNAQKKRQKNEKSDSDRKFHNPFSIHETVRFKEATPDEIEMPIVTSGIMTSASATAAVQYNIVTNCLLTSASTWTSVAQSSYLPGLATTYQTYRVISVSIEGEWFSRAATARTHVISAHSPSNPSYATADLGAASMPMSDYWIVPGLNGNPNHGKIKRTFVTIRDIVGNKTPKFEENYSSGISTLGVFGTPTNSTDFFVLMFPELGGSFTAGDVPLFRFRIVQNVLFYDKRPT